MNITAYRSAGGKFFRGKGTFSLHSGAGQSTEWDWFRLVLLNAAAVQITRSRRTHTAFSQYDGWATGMETMLSTTSSFARRKKLCYCSWVWFVLFFFLRTLWNALWLAPLIKLFKSMKEETMWKKEKKINIFPNTLLSKEIKSPDPYQNFTFNC